MTAPEGAAISLRPESPAAGILRWWSGMPGACDPAWTPQEFGTWGEEWAAWYYVHRRGSRLIRRNLRGEGYEADLVVQEDEWLVFVEVKVRDARDPAPLAEAREPRRRENLSQAASEMFFRLEPPRPWLRFDVLLVTPDLAKPRSPAIHLWLDCWRPDWDARTYPSPTPWRVVSPAAPGRDP